MLTGWSRQKSETMMRLAQEKNMLEVQHVSEKKEKQVTPTKETIESWEMGKNIPRDNSLNYWINALNEKFGTTVNVAQFNDTKTEMGMSELFGTPHFALMHEKLDEIIRLISELTEEKISQEKYKIISKKLSQKNIANEDPEKEAEEWFKKYKELKDLLAQRSDTEELIKQAKEKLAKGDLDGSEKLLEANLKNFWRPLPERQDAYVLLLDWRYRLTKSYGREDVMTELHTWAQKDHPLRVRLLHGRGGAGKTRLAAELCTELSEQGWIAEFIHRQEKIDSIAERVASNNARKTLYVFDYPEERPKHLNKFLSELDRISSTSPCFIRVLLLSRQEEFWWLNRLKYRRMDKNVFDAPEIEIKPIESDEDILKMFRSTCQCLYNHYNRPPPICDDQVIRDWIQSNEQHSIPLFIIAYAIHTVFIDPSGTSLMGGEVIKALIQRERSYMDAIGKKVGFGRETVSRLVGLAAIPGRLDENLLRSLAERKLKMGLKDRKKVIDRAKKLSMWKVQQKNSHMGTTDEKIGCIQPLLPDICGSALFYEVLSEREEMAPAWLWSVMPKDEKGMMDRIGRIQNDINVIYGDSDRFQTWLLKMIQEDTSRARDLTGLVEERRLPFVVLPFATAIDSAMIDLSKEQEKDKAHWLSSLAYHLWYSEKPENAVKSIKEAVEIQRKLSGSHSTKEREEFAEGLHTQALIQQALKEWDEALEAIEEAIPILESLSSEGGVKALFKLARSHNQWALALGDVGRREEAYKVSLKTVSIHRGLEQDANREMREEMGRALYVLSGFENDSEKALEILNESVGMLRKAANQSWRFDPKFVGLLYGATLELWQLDKKQETLDSCFEAIDSYEQQVKVNPRRFGTTLAGIYMDLGYKVVEIGKTELGHEVCTKAISLLEDLKKSDPVNWDVHRLWILVGGYTNRGNSSRKSEDRDDAITDYTTAINLCKKGREEFGVNAQIDVGRSICIANRSIELLKKGDYKKAQEDISDLINWEECLRRELGGKWPVRDSHEQLVKSLSVLSNVLLEMKTDLVDEALRIVDIEFLILRSFWESGDFFLRCDYTVKLQSLGQVLILAGREEGHTHMREGLERGEEIISAWPEKLKGTNEHVTLLNQMAYFIYWYKDHTGTNWGSLTKAESWAREQLSLTTEDDFAQLYAHSTLGQVLMLRGERGHSDQILTESLQHLEIALELCIKHNLSDSVKELQENIARINHNI